MFINFSLKIIINHDLLYVIVFHIILAVVSYIWIFFVRILTSIWRIIFTFFNVPIWSFMLIHYTAVFTLLFWNSDQWNIIIAIITCLQLWLYNLQLYSTEVSYIHIVVILSLHFLWGDNYGLLITAIFICVIYTLWIWSILQFCSVLLY